jgi:hypothetical protein
MKSMLKIAALGLLLSLLSGLNPLTAFDIDSFNLCRSAGMHLFCFTGRHETILAITPETARSTSAYERVSSCSTGWHMIRQHACFTQRPRYGSTGSVGRTRGARPSGFIALGFQTGILSSRADLPAGHADLTYGNIAGPFFGFHLAALLKNGIIGIRPEINYLVHGIKTLERDTGEQIKSRYKISYLEIPLLLVFRIPLRGKIEPRVLIGPYLGIPLKVTEVQTAFGETKRRDLGDNLKNPDAGLALGIQTGFRMGHMLLIFGARFRIGLLDISRDIREISYDFAEGDKVRNRALSLAIGAAFNLSGH